LTSSSLCWMTGAKDSWMPPQRSLKKWWEENRRGTKKNDRNGSVGWHSWEPNKLPADTNTKHVLVSHTSQQSMYMHPQDIYSHTLHQHRQHLPTNTANTSLLHYIKCTHQYFRQLILWPIRRRVNVNFVGEC